MTYTGPEKRIEQRRKTAKDRREVIRFEPDKDPRRSGKDRRTGDLWKGREQF
jgi:hypothetical protein